MALAVPWDGSEWDLGAGERGQRQRWMVDRVLLEPRNDDLL